MLDDESKPATLGAAAYRQLVGVDKAPLLVLVDNTRGFAAPEREMAKLLDAAR